MTKFRVFKLAILKSERHFLRNRSSYGCLRDCLSKFLGCSGLKVNEEKTEFFLVYAQGIQSLKGSLKNLKLVLKSLACILIITM